jgi:phosphoglycerol transferase MdoB-like AlkP superfamily enzyme
VYLIWRMEEESQYSIGRPDRGIALLRESFKAMSAKPSDNYNRPLRNIRQPIAKTSADDLHSLPPKTNVLMITLESFGADIMDRHPEYTPFLSKFRQESLDMTHHYTSAFRTAGAVWSLLCGSQNPVPFFVNREFPRTRMFCLPAVMKERGYHTLWVMGCPRTFDNYQDWLIANGVDRIVAQEDFPPETERISYGVHDGPMLDRLLAEMDKLPQPFFVGALTVSTHHPFSVPTAFREAHPEIADWDSEYQTLFYTDAMLARFIDQSRTRPWAANTLIVIVGDHPLWFTQNGGLSDPVDLAATRARYQTFAVMNHPQIPPTLYEPTTGHADVPATIMDFLGGTYESDFAAPGIFRATAAPRRVPSQEYSRWQPYTVFGEHRAILRSPVEETCVTTDEAASQTRRPCTPEERRIADDIKESQFDTVQWQAMRSQRMIMVK